MTANLVFGEEVKRRQRMTDNLISIYETNTIVTLMYIVKLKKNFYKYKDEKNPIVGRTMLITANILATALASQAKLVEQPANDCTLSVAVELVLLLVHFAQAVTVSDASRRKQFPKFQSILNISF